MTTERVYVLTVDGRAILLFSALTLAEARQLPEEQWLRDDLSLLRSNTVPLWDGSSPLGLRPATTDEEDLFTARREVASDDDGSLFMVYLVELDDARP